MNTFYALIVSAAVGIGSLAAIATTEPPKGDLTGCKLVHVYEDGSFAMTCPPISTPEWGPGGYPL